MSKWTVAPVWASNCLTSGASGVMNGSLAAQTVIVWPASVFPPEAEVEAVLDPDDEHATIEATRRVAIAVPVILRRRPEPVIRRASLDCRLDRRERFLDERSGCVMHGLTPDLQLRRRRAGSGRQLACSLDDMDARL